MENSEALTCTESFSYSWLIDHNHDKQHSFFSYHEPNDLNFKFDVPAVITSPTHFVHAHQIFSHGQIKPISTISLPSSPLISFHSPTTPPFLADKKRRRCHSYILVKFRLSSKKILHKCLGFVCKSLRKSSRVDDLERKVIAVRSSPRRSSSSAFPVVEYGSSDDDFKKMAISSVWCDAENSIQEAILYCKRSIEK